MNTTAKALIFAVVSVASAASIGMGLADRMAPQQQAEVVKLERVVVVGKRIEQLPRVVVVGRRAQSLASDLQVASL